MAYVFLQHDGGKIVAKIIEVLRRAATIGIGTIVMAQRANP